MASPNHTYDSLKMENVPLFKPEFPKFIKTTSLDSSTTFQVNKIDSILPDSGEGFLKQSLSGAETSLPLYSNTTPYFILNSKNNLSPFTSSPQSPQSKLYFKSGEVYNSPISENVTYLNKESNSIKTDNICEPSNFKNDNQFPNVSRSPSKFFSRTNLTLSPIKPLPKAETIASNYVHSSIGSTNAVDPPLKDVSLDQDKSKERSNSTKSEQKKHHLHIFNWNIGNIFTKTDIPIESEINLTGSKDPGSSALTDIIEGYFASPRSGLFHSSIISGNDTIIIPKKKLSGEVENKEASNKKSERRHSFSMLSGRFRKHKEKNDWKLRELTTAEVKLEDYSGKLYDEEKQFESPLLVKNKKEVVENVTIETRLILIENQAQEEGIGEELRYWVKEDLIKILQEGKLRVFKDSSGQAFITVDVSKLPPLDL